MRNGQNNKRMRGRNRGNRGPNPLSRTYESNGPDIKVRGTAQHVAEKYLQLARDAHSSGDPVAAENYLQHAEHYFRIIAAAHEAFRPQTGAPGESQVDDDNGDDDDDDSLNMLDRRFEMPVLPQRPDQRPEQPRNDQQPRQDFGPRPQQPREFRQPRFAPDSEQPPLEGGDDQPSLEGGAEGEGFQPRRERFNADGQPGFDGARRESRRERFERRRAERFDRGPRPEGAPAAEIAAPAADEPGLGLPSFITGAPAVEAPAAEGVLRTRRRRGKFSAPEEGGEGSAAE